MENKKIIYIVIVVLVLAVGYWFYRKSKMTTDDGSTQKKAQEEAEELQQAAIVNREIVVEKSLQQSQKDKAYQLAVKIYKDMRGINAHDMDPYLELYNMPDDQFFYFVQVAYPQVDSNSFLQRMNKQNWKVVKKAKVGAFGIIPLVWLTAQLFDGKWSSGAAVQLIANIKKRMTNFKI